jgi:uncharacterized protein (DUF302 family)
MSINATDSKGIVTKSSKYSIPETLERIQQTIRAKGLMQFAVIDHSGEAAKIGLKLQDAKLVLFGSPKAGTPLMVTSPRIALGTSGRIEKGGSLQATIAQRTLPSEVPLT